MSAGSVTYFTSKGCALTAPGAETVRMAGVFLCVRRMHVSEGIRAAAGFDTVGRRST